ncbi:hypothetical protein TELCIR_15672, partial [Teladorsagia circumcincta]
MIHATFDEGPTSMRMAAFLNVNYEGDDLLPVMLVVFNLIPVSIFLAVMSFTIVINFGVALVVQNVLRAGFNGNVACRTMLRYLALCYVALIVLTVAVLQKHKPCVNGELENDQCYCRDGWTGASCHRRMNCDGYEREANGSCVQCSEGWTGVDCDAIQCNGHGTPNYDLTSCHCEKPYS